MTLGIGLVVAVLVVNAGLTYRNTNRLDEDAGWVGNTHEVLDLTANVLLTLVDAETGQRGFLVTGHDEFLQPYAAAVNRLDGQMATLKDKTRDNDRQQARIAELEQMTAEQLALLKQGIELRRQSAQEAQAFLLTEKGKSQMDAIRELVAQMEREEHDLLEVRQRQSSHTYRVAITTGLLTAFLGLLVVGAFVWLVERSLSARQKAAAVLHEQREWFRTTLASIGDGVIATDTEARVTFLNAVAQGLTGWKDDQAHGLSLERVFQIVNEETRRPVENVALRALREGTIVGLANHNVLIARNGTECPIDDSAAPIRNEKGRVVGVVLVFRDVSARKRDVAALRRQAALLHDERELLRVTLASIGDAVITTDTEGRVTFLNAVAEGLTGWGQGEAAGQPLETVLRIMNEQDRQPAENPALRALREGRIVGLANHTVLIARDGSERPIDDSAAPIRDEQGHVAGCVLIFRDITERRRLEQQIRDRLAAARFLASIVESSGDGILSMSLDGTIQSWNAAAQRLFGYTAAQTVGHHVSLIIPADRADEEEQILTRIRAGEQVEHFETVRLRSDGQPIHVSLTISPIVDEAGRVVGASKTARDITDRKQAEERVYSLLTNLQDADRRKDEFLATLAHELRGPLAPLRNMLELMKRADVSADLILRARATMERQLGLMVRLVDDLLDVSRITRNKLELRRERVELASVISQSVEACRPLVESANHELNVALPPQPIFLHADPVRLAQVFSNLLNNACKYTEPGGRIGLAVERQGSDVVVSVKDTGVGIAPEMRSRIFEMFAQVEGSLERAQGGLGIGLTLVKRLVEMHGGSVDVTSDGLGRGSEFVVRLPILIEKPGAQQPSQPTGELPAPAHRILVVDDNRDSAASLALLLNLTGCETHTAYDGLEALAAAEKFRPAVVLLDIGLPKLNGHEAARRIREQPWGKDMVLVALTGWGQDEDRRKSRDAGFDGHLVKPVDFAALMKLLAETQPKQV